MGMWGSPAAASATVARVRSTRALQLLLGAVLALALLVVPQQAAAEWSGPVEISDADTRNAEDLDVDASDLGVFLAAWGYGSDDVASVVDPLTSGPGAPQKFEGDYGPPTIGIGGSNVGAIAFQSTLGGSSRGIFAAGKPGGSNAFGSVDQIQGPNDETATGGAILTVNNQGTGMLFHDIGDAVFGFGHDIKGRVLSNPAANTWSSGSDFGAGQSFTQNRVVAAGPDGSTVLAWKSENGINFRTIEVAVLENSGSASNGANIEASSGNDPGDLSNQSGIAVDRMPDSSVALAYSTIPGGSGGVYAAHFAKSRAAGGGGGDVGAVRQSDDADGSVPDIATDDAGNTLLTWYDPSDGGADQNALRAKFRPAGGSYGPTETIAAGDVTSSYDMEMDGLGYARVVYATSTGDAIEARTRMPGAAGSWSAPELLSDGLSDVADPHVAVGRDYEAFASWLADPANNNQERVYMASLPQPACADGVDNDGDGKVDHPADPGCSSPTDDDETDPTDPGGDTDAPDGSVKKKGKAKAGKTIKLQVSSDEDGSVLAKGTQKQTSKSKKGKKRSAAANVEIAGKKVKVTLKPARAQLSADQNKTLKLKPKGKKNKKKAKKLKKAVKKGAKAKAKLKVTFTDQAGNSSIEKLNLKLK